MEPEKSDQDAVKRAKLIDAVLHTKQQRKKSQFHEELLRKKGKNAIRIDCKDISSISALNMDEYGSLHLIVDTRMYDILMDDGYLRDVARRKFRELDESEKTIYVLNTFQSEFDVLYSQIPQNAKELWVQNIGQPQFDKGSSHQHVTKLHVEGVSGEKVETANTSGHNEGGMGNNSTGDVTIDSGMKGISMDTFTRDQFNFYIGTKAKYEVAFRRFRDQDSSSIKVEQSSASSPHSETVVTISDPEKEKEIADEVKNNIDKLLSNDVREVEVETGSVIIKLTVDKNHMMTDEWLQMILKIIFYDILGDFFTEGTTFQVTVERHVCLDEEELLNLYSFKQSHRDCVPKAKYEAMKSQFEALSLQGASSFNIEPDTVDDEMLNQEPMEPKKTDDNILEENERRLKQTIMPRSQDFNSKNGEKFRWEPKRHDHRPKEVLDECRYLREKIQNEQKTPNGHTFLLFGPPSHGKSSVANGFLTALENKSSPPCYQFVAKSAKSFSVKNYKLHRIINMPWIFEASKITDENIEKIVRGEVPLYSKLSDTFGNRDQQITSDTMECIIIVLRYDCELTPELKRLIGVILNRCGQGELACHLVLTHLDVCDQQFRDTANLPKLYDSEKVQRAVERMSIETGIPLSKISFVRNYAYENQTDPNSNLQYLRILDVVNEAADMVVEARNTTKSVA